MDLDLIFGKKEPEKRKRKRKPGRPKGSYTVNKKNINHRSGLTAKQQKEANRQFAFDWCYRHNFDLIGLAKNQFIFRDKVKTWLVYEKPYDEETDYIPSEIPISHVKDY